MNDLQVRKLDKFQRELAFMQDNAADFPKDSPGDKTAIRLAEIVTLIQTLAARQSSEAARQNIGIKDDTLDQMIKLLQQINRAANALAEEIDGIEDLFRMPRKRSEAIWLAKARTFHTDSAQYETELQELISVPDFRTALNGLINQVEQAATSADIAVEQKGGATGGLIAAFKDGGKTSRRLNAIVRNKYADNPQKLAAWEVASHLEAAPKRKDNGGNPPTT